MNESKGLFMPRYIIKLVSLKTIIFSMLLAGIFVSLHSDTVLAKSKEMKAVDTAISLVDGIAVAPNGDVAIARRSHNIISLIDSKGMLTNIVGDGGSGYSGDGGPATKANLKLPAGLTYDQQGNLYIADRENHRVRKVDTKGIITTIAGNGTAGFSGDGGPAVKASLNLPAGVAVDNDGNIFISDRSNDRIRKVDSKGIITTFAGSGKEGYNGDSIPALKASIDKPFGLALDNKGSLYIADRGNNRIRKVNKAGVITTVAGDGGFFFIGDNGPAYRASIAAPTGMVVDDKGNVYIADWNNNRIRVVDTLGMIRTVVGTGQQDYNGDSEVARETNLHLPFGVALDKEGNLLVIDRSHYRIRKIDPNGSKVVTIAGNGIKEFGGDGGPAVGAMLSFPHGIAVDKNDNVIFADRQNHRIRKIDTKGIITTIIGDGVRGNLGDGGSALKANIYAPSDLEISEKGEMFFISPSGFISLIRRVDTKGNIHHFMDTSEERYKKSIIRSASLALSSKQELAPITHFSDLALDGKGNMYIADRINHQIRKVSSDGKITTFAGTGESDFSGDGGPAIKARFRDPQALVLDKEGNLYIADAANNKIRKIDTKGIVTTLAGNGKHEDTGDGGPALEAGIRSIDSLRFSPSGELHIVESNTHHIRKITKDGKIVTVAGRRGVQGYFGDGGPAVKAMLKQPRSIAFDSKGNMFITDMGNNRIRKVDTNGIMTTVSGSGTFGWGHEGEKVEIYFQNFP
jgi:sugar lactone lactonase YvrE